MVTEAARLVSKAAELARIGLWTTAIEGSRWLILVIVDVEIFEGQPFTAEQAREAGVGWAQLRRWHEDGLVRRVAQSVYVARGVPDSRELRCAAIRLVVSPDAVITDETAAWLHGADGVLRPNADLRPPEVAAFHRSRGARVKRDGVTSGQRMMPDSDVMEIDGLVVTTPLRTTIDLGRQKNRFRGIGGIDAMLRIGVPLDDVIADIPRFRGYRGVRNLRALAPLGDGRSESPGESALRLHWYDAGLPRPRCQVPVDTPWGTYWLDIGHEESRLAAEYDGAAFHDEDDEEHDDSRRGRAEDEGWTVVVARRNHVFGPEQCASAMLRAAAADATRSSRRQRGSLDLPFVRSLHPIPAASMTKRAASVPKRAASR